jgi:hypothetical protein
MDTRGPPAFDLHLRVSKTAGISTGSVEAPAWQQHGNMERFVSQVWSTAGGKTLALTLIDHVHGCVGDHRIGCFHAAPCYCAQEAAKLIVQGIEQGVGVGYGLEAASALTPPAQPNVKSIPQQPWGGGINPGGPEVPASQMPPHDAWQGSRP